MVEGLRVQSDDGRGMSRPGVPMVEAEQSRGLLPMVEAEQSRSVNGRGPQDIEGSSAESRRADQECRW